MLYEITMATNRWLFSLLRSLSLSLCLSRLCIPLPLPVSVALLPVPLSSCLPMLSPRGALSRLRVWTHQCLQVPLLAAQMLTPSWTTRSTDAVHGDKAAILLVVTLRAPCVALPFLVPRRRRRVYSFLRRRYRSLSLIHLKNASR